MITYLKLELKSPQPMAFLMKHDVNFPKARLQLRSTTIPLSLHSLPVPVQPGHRGTIVS